MENIELYQGNCLDLMKNIPNEFIDCVITDPPYFIDGMDNNWDIEKLNNKVKKSKCYRFIASRDEI